MVRRGGGGEDGMEERDAYSKEGMFFNFSSTTIAKTSAGLER